MTSITNTSMTQGIPAINNSKSKISLLRDESVELSRLALTGVVGAVALGIIFGSGVGVLGGIVCGISLYLTGRVCQLSGNGEPLDQAPKNFCKSTILIGILEQFAQNPASLDNIPTDLFSKEENSDSALLTKEEKSVLEELKNSFLSATKKEDVEGTIKPSLEKTSEEFQDVFEVFFKTKGLLDLAYENQKNTKGTKLIPEALALKFRKNVKFGKTLLNMTRFLCRAVIVHEASLLILTPIAAVSLPKSLGIMIVGKILTSIIVDATKPAKESTQLA